jgi:hypothetical protein
MFEGNEFYMFVYKSYPDVRLVGAPPKCHRQVRRRHRQLAVASPHG